MKRFFIVAGDPSADRYSANLIREIKLRNPDTTFWGIGGDEMIKEGLISIAHISDVSVVGFWEVAKRYNFFKLLLKKSADILKENNIDAFIPVDYPGFNIRLAKIANKNNIPVYYYIAPQLWAWGKNRAKELQSIVEKLFVVFPFEAEYFSNFGINSIYLGHPILDNVEFNQEFKTYDQRNQNIAFFPGSRIQEVTKHIALLKSILDINDKKHKYNFVIAKSSNIPLSAFEMIADYSNVEISEDNIGIMQNSLAGIIKTGTSNLEAALCGLPFGMYYKTSFITYKIAEKLVNLPYISIVNILSNKFVVKEFIQKEANPVSILDYISGLIKDRETYEGIQSQFSELKELLGKGGATKKIAEEILRN